MKKKPFVWQGISSQEQKISGELLAQSINLAKIHLERQKIQIISIRRKYKFTDYFQMQKISPLDIAIFFRQLATLITANIPLVQSFEILRQSQEKIPLQHVINAIKIEMESGKNLVTGLRQFPQHFDALNCHLIHAGEYSGTLEKMLNRVAQHKENALAMKAQIKQAMFYPISILCVALVVCLLMLLFIVPRFAELFDSMHASLPGFTLGVLHLSSLLQEKSWLFGLPLLGGGGFFYYFKYSTKLRQEFDHLLLRIPWLGSIIKKIILIRFTRNLAIMVSANIALNDALTIIAPICGNHCYWHAIQTLQRNVLSGQELHKGMQLNPLFTPLAVQMIRIGEESGNIEAMLTKVAELYEADIERLVANLNQLLEPLIMVILGVLIGGLVIAMYLPIFRLGALM